MAVYGGRWELLFKVFQQREKGGFLFGCPCVLRPHLLVAATDIAHTYRPCIMASTMRTDHRNRSAAMYAAVTIDDIVITDTLEFSLLVPSVYLGYRHIPTFWCGRAMHDDFVYFPHDFEKV